MLPAIALPRCLKHGRPARSDMEIDLADLIEEPVPRSRKICCPFHDEKTPSMHIYPDHYYCFGCGAHGDHVDWLMRVEDLNHDEARARARQLGRAGRPRRAHGDATTTLKERHAPCNWWDAASRSSDTLAARYLGDVRGIDLDALPANIDDALRFHPSCPFGPGTVHPCLLALMRDPISDAPTGIQRIALTADAQKIDRMMLGPAGVVKLWPAGEQAGHRRRAGDDTRRRHAAALSRRAAAAGLGGALGRRP